MSSYLFYEFEDTQEYMWLDTYGENDISEETLSYILKWVEEHNSLEYELVSNEN